MCIRSWILGYDMLGSKKWFSITWGNAWFARESKAAEWKVCLDTVVAESLPLQTEIDFNQYTSKRKNNTHSFLCPCLCVQQNRTCREHAARWQHFRHSPNSWWFAIRSAFLIQVLPYNAGLDCFHVSIFKIFSSDFVRRAADSSCDSTEASTKGHEEHWRANWAFCPWFRVEYSQMVSFMVFAWQCWLSAAMQ